MSFLMTAVGLVWLAQERRSVSLCLELRIGDLVPDDRGKVVEADGPTPLLNRRVKRYDRMPPFVLPARQADVADDANQPAARDQRVETPPPAVSSSIEELSYS